MPLTTRVWGAGKLLLLCGALLLTYVLFAAASMRMALKTREVVVPELAGKTVNDATAALAEAGLTLKVEDGRQVDPKVPAGQILAQEPLRARGRAASAASGSGSAPARGRRSFPGSSASPSGRRSCGCSRTGSASGQRPRFDRSTTPPGRWSRRIRPPRASPTRCRCSSIAASAARRT